jgi:hypothetical protein
MFKKILLVAMFIGTTANAQSISRFDEAGTLSANDVLDLTQALTAPEVQGNEFIRSGAFAQTRVYELEMKRGPNETTTYAIKSTRGPGRDFEFTITGRMKCDDAPAADQMPCRMTYETKLKLVK